MVTLMAKRINENDAAGPNNPTYRERFDGVTAGARALLKTITTDDKPFTQILSKVPFRIAGTNDIDSHDPEYFAYSGVRCSSVV